MLAREKTIVSTYIVTITVICHHVWIYQPNSSKHSQPPPIEESRIFGCTFGGSTIHEAGVKHEFIM